MNYNRRYGRRPIVGRFQVRSYEHEISRLFADAWADKTVWPSWLTEIQVRIIPAGIVKQVEAIFVITVKGETETISRPVHISIVPYRLLPDERETRLCDGRAVVDGLKSEPLSAEMIRAKTYQALKKLFTRIKPEWTALENL